MRRFAVGLVFLALLATAGCSGSPAGTPQGQLATINEMLAKGYEMTGEQRREIDERIAKAGELLQSGQQQQASKVLAEVLSDLEVLAETDRFNKSE